ncbi:MAG: histidinol dehydrogenase, partial [Alcaligenaceae bacterium]|nr:histidinol dehydrogenase [Alcaligenaceae bacterium]
MLSIKRLSSASENFAATLRQLLAFDASQDESIERTTADILRQVHEHGDQALLGFTQRFDHVQAESVAALEIPKSEWHAALDSLPADQRAALEAAALRVRAYHERQRAESWSYTEADGTVLGQKITPLDRVGLYVPGGKAA